MLQDVRALVWFQESRGMMVFCVTKRERKNPPSLIGTWEDAASKVGASKTPILLRTTN